MGPARQERRAAPDPRPGGRDALPACARGPAADPGAGFHRRGRRGTPRNHEGKTKPVSRRPWARPRRVEPVTSRRPLRRRRLGLWRPSSTVRRPLLEGGGPWRPADHGPRPRTRLVVGGSSVVWRYPRVCGSGLKRPNPRRDTLRRAALPGAMAKPGHRRGRRLVLPNPSTRSAEGPPVGGRRVAAGKHEIGILSMFLWMDIRRSARPSAPGFTTAGLRKRGLRRAVLPERTARVSDFRSRHPPHGCKIRHRFGLVRPSIGVA